MSKQQNAVVKLSAPLQTHQGFVHEVQFRPPVMSEYMDIGEPWSFSRTPNGTVIDVEDKDAIKQYIEKLVVPPVQPIMLEGLPLEDARAIKRGIVSLFLGAASAAEPSTTSESA